MPANLADHCIENQSWDLFNYGPVSADGLRARIQPIRQDASAAQENRMQIHACTISDATGACESMRQVTGWPGARAVPGDECSATKSAAKCNGSIWIVSGSAAERLAVSHRLTGSRR